MFVSISYVRTCPLCLNEFFFNDKCSLTELFSATTIEQYFPSIHKISFLTQQVGMPVDKNSIFKLQVMFETCFLLHAFIVGLFVFNFAMHYTYKANNKSSLFTMKPILSTGRWLVSSCLSPSSLATWRNKMSSCVGFHSFSWPYSIQPTSRIQSSVLSGS